MEAYTSACHTDFTAWHHGGTRKVGDIQLIVMHSTEGGSAKSNARYFATSAAGGSAHLVVDDIACYRCLPNSVVPWGAPGANTNGFHIEQAGYASWTREQWLEHDDMLHRGAYKAAVHAVLFKIPPMFVSASGLKNHRRGITTHAEVSKAFPNDSGNHHDPGTDWPRDRFMSYVRHYYAELNA